MKNKGITLISLVVTIIILLILAGVMLALISGSDGILGRATSAVDENKRAMAKEQVELAIGDFQTEFFDEKYVERTNDGEKKEYISEKLMQGVETTDFYAKATEDGMVNVYDLGKVQDGKEVVIGAIENDGSINWNGKAAGGSNNTSVDLSNYVTKEEYEQLREKVDNLLTQIHTSECKAGTANLGTIAKVSGTSANITFSQLFQNSNYSVTVTNTASVGRWANVNYLVTDKTSNGFTINA